MTRVENFPTLIVAFSNTDGGVVLIGVDDRGQPTGRRLTGDLEADLPQAVRQTVNPGRYDVGEMQVGDLPVIVIGVARRREGAAQLPDGAVLVRRGASNVPLLGEALVSLISRRALTRFETTAVDVTLESAEWAWGVSVPTLSQLKTLAQSTLSSTAREALAGITIDDVLAESQAFATSLAAGASTAAVCRTCGSRAGRTPP